MFTRNYLPVVLEGVGIAQVPGTPEMMRSMINQSRSNITAEVTTAVALDAEMQRLVAERLAAYLNRAPDKVTISSRVDPAIIGGVVARVGDRLIDDSVRGRLQRLRRTLSGTTRYLND